MEKLKLEKIQKNNIKYTRNTAKNVLDNIVKRIEEINSNDKCIYKIVKAVLFGSYINSNKEKIGDLDIAIYAELKNKEKPEYEQNFEESKKSKTYIPYVYRFIYAKDQVFKYIKDKKRILQLHDGFKVDGDAKKFNEPVSYIYFDKYKIIYEEGKTC